MTRIARTLRFCLPVCYLLASAGPARPAAGDVEIGVARVAGLGAVAAPAADRDAGGDVIRAWIVAPETVIPLAGGEPGATVEAAWGGGPLRPVPGETRAPARGAHWLAVAARDTAGNLSPVRWHRLRVDDEPPAVTLRAEPVPVIDDAGRRWVAPAAEVIAGADDALAGVGRLWLELPSGRREAAPPATVLETSREIRTALPASVGGAVTLRAGADDRVGNRAPETRLELAVDRRPPAVAIRVLGPRVDDGRGDDTEIGAPRPDPADTGTAGDGTASDGTAGGGTPVLGPRSTLELAADDDESGLATIVTRLDGAAAERAAWTGPFAAGEHRAEVTARDRVGNESVAELVFTVDAEGPRIDWRVTSAGARGDDGVTYYRPPVTVHAAAADAPAGVAGLEVVEEGTPISFADTEGITTPSSITGTRVVDGDHLMLRATDRLGNASEIRAEWALDVTPPMIALRVAGGEPLPPGHHRLPRDTTLEPAVTDDGSGVASATLVLNRLAVPGKGPPRPLPERLVLERRGRHLLEIEARDRLGNDVTLRWRLDVGPGAGR